VLPAIWTERKGERQDVKIDLREAIYNTNPLMTPIMQHRIAAGRVAANDPVPRSFTFTPTINGILYQAPLGPGNPFTFVAFQTKDGRYANVTGAYPHLNNRALNLLGAKPNRQSIESAIKQWDSQAFEDAMGETRTVGAIHRTTQVGAWFPSASSGLYIKPGMFTTYSSDTGSTIADFCKSEHFYMLEVGLTGLAGNGVPIQARGPMDANNIHITGWYRDPLPNGSPRAYGFAFNANRMYGANIMWFLRGGWSEGFLSNGAVSGGLGCRPPKAASDLFGVGFGWTHLVPAALHGQYTAETFYRFHVFPNFAITPDIQLVLHLSANPTVSTIWVFSLRGRVTF
jgi:hypothetical protein